MNRLSIHALSLLALAIGVPSAPAQAQVVPPAPTVLPSPLTLSQALAIALRQQPQQYIARASTTQALGNKQQATAQYFPTLTPSYEYQNHSTTYYSVPTQTISIPGTTGSNGMTGVGTTVTSAANQVSVVRGGGLSVALAQTLFDSGQRELANAEARRAVEAARYGEVNTRQEVILSVTQDFYTLLQDIDLVKVARAQVTRYQQTLDVTQAQVTAGTVAAITIYQARADLASAQVTLLQDQNSVSTATAALKNSLGVETDDPVQPAPLAPGDRLPPLPAPGPQETLDEYIRDAYASRPDLRQQQSTVQGDAAAAKAAQINTGLSLSTTLALTYQATNDVGYRGLDTQVLFTGSYPLFDAGRSRGAARVARAQRDAAEDQLALVRQSIRQGVEQAHSTRAEALQAATLAQAAVTAAQVNYDAAVASQKAGVDTTLDVTTAQATLTQAQDQYVTAIYNFYTADAALRRAVGRNDVLPLVPRA